MVIDLICHIDTDACNTREVCGRPNAHSLVIYNTLFQLLIGACHLKLWELKYKNASKAHWSVTMPLAEQFCVIVRIIEMARNHFVHFLPPFLTLVPSAVYLSVGAVYSCLSLVS